MINDKFIHIHIPRTGGQLLRGVIFNNVHKFKFLVRDSHLTLQDSLDILHENMPDASVPTFCVVRNPWEWYVSRYFFRQKKDAISAQQIIDVEQHGNNIEGFHKHLSILNGHIEDGTEIVPIKGCLPRIWKRLTLSQFYNEMTEDKMDHIARMENFVSDLSSILNKIDGDIFPMSYLDKKLKNKYNHSKHDHYKKYYTDELVELVGEWDKEYIEKFGYTF